MKIISSAEFRKTYPRLTEEVIVTVQGHAIGRWVPAVMRDAAGMQYIDTAALEEAPVRVSRQAQRDAILRRINKGG